MMKDVKSTGIPSVDRPWETGYSYLKRKPIIPNMNVYSLLKLLCFGKMDKSAINCGELTVNYRQMFRDADTVSQALKALGVRRGDIIAICMPNFYQAVLPFLACNRIGAIATYLNPGMSNEEIKGYLRQFSSPVLFNFDRSEDDYSSLLKNTATKYTITLHSENLNELRLDRYSSNQYENCHLDFHSLGSIKSKGNSTHSSIFSGQEVALILYTSGSTGQPKAVVLNNENIISALMYMNNTSNWKKLHVDSMLICVPFAYPYGFVTSLLGALFSGSKAILAPDIGANTVSYYYTKNPCMIMGSPALLDLTMQNIPESQDLSSVRFFISGGDFLTIHHEEKGKAFFSKHHASTEMGNGSGNAETVSIGTTPLGVKKKPGTVGMVLVGSSARVIDPETMQQKGYREEGMLCVAGKHVFKEYYKEPKLTAEAKILLDGKEYFKTGTLGFLDEDGYFTLTGRASRFYICSSLDKIYMDHVQNVINCFDCVSDCAVVKVPDEKKLYVNYVYVVLEHGWKDDDDTRERILSLCRQPVVTGEGKTDQLKDFEIPQKVFFLKELPRRSGTDKINYQVLEQLAAENKNK